MIRLTRILLLLLSFAGATVARAQVPVWPKTTPADVTAAGLDVQVTGADFGNGTFVLAVYFGGGPATPTIVPAVYTSPDGITWTRRNLPGLNGRTGAPRFLNGKFLLGSGLAGGGYTLQLTGGAGATGNALVELYDTAAPSSITANSARFTNLSARTFGGTGNDTLIVGFNVTGTGSRRLVIRAVGPGLGAFGVTGTMADPKIELYSGQNKIGENDNWDATTLAAQQAVGAFALTSGSRDAVLVTTLNPGGYTVQITGGTTGVVLVEAYEAP